MKKRAIVLMTLFALSLIAVSCGSKTADSNSTTTSSKEMYRCPMDTEVTSDKPGKCPKCGMDLEKVETTDSTKTK